MRLLGEILTPLVFAAGLGISSIAAGGGFDAWWCRREALERRKATRLPSPVVASGEHPAAS
jgi:hypothetical protein